MVAPRVAGTVDRHVDLVSRVRLFPCQRYTTWQKIIAQRCRRALAWINEAMWQASTRRLPASCVSVSLLNIKAGCDCAFGVWSGGCGGVERWQPHTEACSLCLFLNRGGGPPKKRKEKHTRPAAVSLPHVLSAADHVQVTLCPQSPLSDCRRSRFVDRNSNRAGMPSLGVTRAVMMPKLQCRSLLPLYKASLNMMNLFFLADSEAPAGSVDLALYRSVLVRLHAAIID